MKRLELINIICDVLQEEGIPYSIIDSVVLDSIYAGSDEFDLEKVDNKYIIECKNNDIDYRYELLIDSNSKKYSLDIKATTKDNSEVVCYSEEKRTIEHTDKSWNSNPGFIVNYNARKTDLSTETKKFVDSALESRVLYDINGVEYKRENRVLEYPERDYVDRFRFGLPETSLRTPSSVIEERIERKGLEKSIGYVEVKEYNNVVDRHENYYRLSNEHGLGTMHFNLGTITQEDYEKLPKEYSEEEIELLAINDSSITTDALKQAYSNSRQR